MSSILKVDQIQLADGSTPTAADLGLNTTGSVIQVQSRDYTGGEQSVTSTTYATTNISHSITPKFANSKIVVIMSTNLRKANTDSSANFTMGLYRNGTLIRDKWQWAFGANSSVQHFGHWSASYVDTPNSTSEQTYVLRGKSSNGGNFILGDTASGGQVVLMEIAG